MPHEIIASPTDSLAIILTPPSGPPQPFISDGYRVTGNLAVRVHGPDGVLKDERLIPNLVVTVGKNAIASLLKSVTTGATLTINNATSSSGLILIQTSTNHGLQTGSDVFIYNVGGTTEANGYWVVTKVSNTTFTLDGSTFTNAYTSGGSCVPGPAEFQWMSIGTGTSGPSAGDTDLAAEISTGLTVRVTITRTNPSGNSILYAATWAPGAGTNGAITEAGIFNSKTLGTAQGTLLARSVFSPIAKAAGDTLTINWTITIS